MLVTGDHRAALRQRRLAAQPRPQRVDLRDPRRRPDARDHHAQRRPLGRLGARARGVHGRRPALRAPGPRDPGRDPARDGARRGVRRAQRRARDVRPGPALVVTLGTLYAFRGLAFLWTNGRQVNAETLPDAFLNLGTGSILGIPTLALHRARRRGRRRPGAARLPRRARAVRDRLEPRGRAARRRALGAARVRAPSSLSGALAGLGGRAVHRPLRHRRRDRRHRLRAHRRSRPPSSAASRSSAARAASTARRSARCCSNTITSSLIVLQGRRVLAAGRDRRAAARRDRLRPPRRPPPRRRPAPKERAPCRLRRRPSCRPPAPPPPPPTRPERGDGGAARDAGRWETLLVALFVVLLPSGRRSRRVPDQRLVHHRLAGLLGDRADGAAAHARDRRGRDRPLGRVGPRAVERADGLRCGTTACRSRLIIPICIVVGGAVRRVQRPARHAPRPAVAGGDDRHARPLPRPGVRRHRRRLGDRLPGAWTDRAFGNFAGTAMPNVIVLFAVLAVAVRACCCTSRRSGARSSPSARTRRRRSSRACASSGSS